MPKGMFTGCIHHPAVVAVAHCHQCAKPVCGGCVVVGPTGKFCSSECRDKHERFMKNAQGRDLVGNPGGGFLHVVRKAVGRVVALAVLLFALGVIGTFFEVPMLSEWTRTLRGMIGF